jgi:hypothetical protein
MLTDEFEFFSQATGSSAGVGSREAAVKPTTYRDV